MFTEEDGANISNDGANINNPLESSSRELLEKPSFLKIAAQAFETGGFLNIFLRFWGFWGSFSYKTFSNKKMCSY